MVCLAQAEQVGEVGLHGRDSWTVVRNDMVELLVCRLPPGAWLLDVGCWGCQLTFTGGKRVFSVVASFNIIKRRPGWEF